MNKKLYATLALVAILALALSACGNEAAPASAVNWWPQNWWNSTMESTLARKCAGLPNGSTAPVNGNQVPCPNGTEIAAPPEIAAPTYNTGDYWDINNCPTNRSVAEQLDIPVDAIVATHGGKDAPWEGCKWQVQQPVAMLLNPDFVFTTRHTDRSIWIETSDGSRLKVIGATIRWAESYKNPSRQWMLDPFLLLSGPDGTGETAGEWFYGQSQDPAYATCPIPALNLKLSAEQAKACK